MPLLSSRNTVELEGPPQSRLEKALTFITVVKAGEGSSVLLLSLNFFVLLSAYYLLKTVRESLILSESTAEVKTYSSAGQALILLMIVPLFGALASRVNRIKLIVGVTLFFASHLVLFFILGERGVHEGVFYYLWVGIFNLLVIAQFWAFANDLYSPEQGKRLFPLIGLGASLGAWIGAILAGRLVRGLGPYPVLLIAAAFLVVCVLISTVVHRRSIREKPSEGSDSAEKPLGREGGFSLIFHDRYLFLIALLTILLNIVNTSGEFLLGKIVVNEAHAAFPGGPETMDARARFVGEFYGNYFGWTNFAGLLLQTFATARVFAKIGVGGALLIGPSIALLGYSLMLASPILALIRAVKVLDNSNDYSIQKTATQALYLPVSREAKYKAKTAIDTFFVRMGDVTQAGVVYLGTALSFSLGMFAGVNLGLTILWLLTALQLRTRLKEKGTD